MKITVEHTENEENEVILRCRELDDEMLRLLALVRAGMQKLLVWNEQKELLPLNASEVVYCETVEEKTFVYTERGMYQTALTLAELEERWAAAGLLRCGKSWVVNLYAIRRLRSCGAGRIEAALSTGEKIVISRHYAPALRERLGMG